MNKQQAIKVLQNVEAHTVREVRDALRAYTGNARVTIDTAREFRGVAVAARATESGGVWLYGTFVTAYWYQDARGKRDGRTGLYAVTVRRDAVVVEHHHARTRYQTKSGRWYSFS